MKFILFAFFAYFLSLPAAKAEIMLSKQVASFKQFLDSKCGNNAVYPFSKDLFPSVGEYVEFEKNLNELLIAKPANACDFLKHPQVFSAISVLPQLQYEPEMEKKVQKNKSKEIEMEYGRKFFISKILELREKLPSIEKETIAKKQALNTEDFYLKMLVACLDTECPRKIRDIITDKIPKTSSHIVYEKNIKELFLDEDDLINFITLDDMFLDKVDFSFKKSAVMKKIYNTHVTNRTEKFVSAFNKQSYFAVISPIDFKKSLNSQEHLKPKEKLRKSCIAKNELEDTHFEAKNPIGFAQPTSELVQSFSGGESDKEISKLLETMKERYKISLVYYGEPSWTSELAHPKKENEDFQKTEIGYEINYLNIYGTVNDDRGHWFQVKNKANQTYWINQAQFKDRVSISNLLLHSYVKNEVEFFESPNGTLAKRTSSNIKFKGFDAKSFSWTDDGQLWVLLNTDISDECSDEGLEGPDSENGPVDYLWIKAFKDDGEFNFEHRSRGC